MIQLCLFLSSFVFAQFIVPYLFGSCITKLIACQSNFYLFWLSALFLFKSVKNEEYMPYLCNLDYVMFGAFGVPLFREHTCFEDGDYCDFKLKLDAKPMEYWPPVFEHGKGYK